MFSSSPPKQSGSKSQTLWIGIHSTREDAHWNSSRLQNSTITKMYSSMWVSSQGVFIYYEKPGTETWNLTKAMGCNILVRTIECRNILFNYYYSGWCVYKVENPPPPKKGGNVQTSKIKTRKSSLVFWEKLTKVIK